MVKKSFKENINTLEFNNVSHTFKQGNTPIKVLNEISFKIKKGSIIGLLGASGSGKSTLLQLAGLIEKPLSGEIKIKGHNSSFFNQEERAITRKKNIGFVFQKSHLLPEFSAIENIFIAQKIFGNFNNESKQQAINFLKSIDLENRFNHRPAQLSGGEQQRVAIARALINNPSIVLADEPTGNLDLETSNKVIGVLMETIKKAKSSAIVATHSSELASKMDYIMELSNGKINVIK